MTTPTGDDRPLLQVVHGGEPTADEIAALVAAVLTRTGDAEAPSAAPSRWASRAASLRRPLTRGPGAWRANGRP